MSNDDPLLDRAAIEDAFRQLGDRLARRGVVADLYVFGGARNGAGLRRPPGHPGHRRRIPPARHRAGGGSGCRDDLGLPQWWHKEQAGSCVAPGGDAAAPRVFGHPGIRVSAASPEHLLAMKVLAARHREAEDIRFLIGRLNLTTTEQVLGLCAYVFRDEEVPGRARLVLDDVFDQL